MKYEVFTSSSKNIISAASKKLLFTLLLLSSFFGGLSFSGGGSLYAQGTWTKRDTLPDSAMFQGIPGFSIGNYGYAGLGEYGNHYFDELWQFDPTTNSWVKKAPFPGSARVAPACFVIGDKAYLVCGSIANGFSCVTECWEYDGTNNTWTQKANFPGPARTYAVGFAIDSIGYVGTGANELSDFRKDFYAYHPSTNTWTRIADFGGIPRDADCGFTVNGKGYVCFGQDSTFRDYNDMWEYDPAINTWTRKSSSADSVFLASGFVICNNIYVGSGDSNNNELLTKFWKYNTISDSWTQEASIPSPARIQGAAFAIGDTGYYGFGQDYTSKTHNIFDNFFAGDSCNLPTGINEAIPNDSKISIYPNPNDGQFIITFSHAELVSASQSKVEIYNVLGEQIYNETLKQVHGDNIIKLINKPSGIYLYRVITQKGDLLGEGKLIIQK